MNNGYNSGIDALEGAYLAENKSITSLLSEDTMMIPTSIAGIDCPDPHQKERVLQAISNESEEHARVLNLLNQKGLERRGVVPTDIFKQLVAQKKMYTFKTIDSEGRVKADLKSFVFKLNEFSISLANGLNVLGCVCMILAGNHFFWHSTGGNFVDLLIGGTFVLYLVRMFGGLLFVNAPKFLSWGMYLLFPEICLWETISNKLTYKNAKAILWPKYQDVDLPEQEFSRGKDDDEELNKTLKGTKVKIKLHPAPKSVQDRLVAWTQAGYQPYLVVDAKAFDVVFDGKLKAIIRKSREILDPMPCVDINGFTVIIDQYGPFLSEQEVVAYVQNHFSLLKNKYGMVQNSN